MKKKRVEKADGEMLRLLRLLRSHYAGGGDLALENALLALMAEHRFGRLSDGLCDTAISMLEGILFYDRPSLAGVDGATIDEARGVGIGSPAPTLAAALMAANPFSRSGPSARLKPLPTATRDAALNYLQEREALVAAVAECRNAPGLISQLRAVRAAIRIVQENVPCR